MNVTVLGAGAWGTALARLLADSGQHVTLWDFFPETLAAIHATGRNERYLPGVELLPAASAQTDVGSRQPMRIEPDIAAALADAEVVVVAIVSKAFRSVTSKLGSYGGIVVSVTKGIEFESGLSMSGVLGETAPNARIVALSGPTLALEVARGVPTAIVAASHDSIASQQIQTLFHRPAFRVYTSTDLLGVELGGALKNVIAIAAGACDGLGFGDNTKASLVTRALSEMRRLGVACGAQPETFNGLSGLGDLMVTCFSRLSRNRGFGERVGRGEKVPDILASMVAVAEGYPTARSARQLANRHQVTTPIIEEVYAALYEGKPPAASLRDLMARSSKAED